MSNIHSTYSNHRMTVLKATTRIGPLFLTPSAAGSLGKIEDRFRHSRPRLGSKARYGWASQGAWNIYLRPIGQARLKKLLLTVDQEGLQPETAGGLQSRKINQIVPVSPAYKPSSPAFSTTDENSAIE